MPPLFDILIETTRVCCLAGLIIFNGLAYYAFPAQPPDSSILLFNLNAGLYLAFIYPGATRTRQMATD